MSISINVSMYLGIATVYLYLYLYLCTYLYSLSTLLSTPSSTPLSTVRTFIGTRPHVVIKGGAAAADQVYGAGGVDHGRVPISGSPRRVGRDRTPCDACGTPAMPTTPAHTRTRGSVCILTHTHGHTHTRARAGAQTSAHAPAQTNTRGAVRLL